MNVALSVCGGCFMLGNSPKPCISQGNVELAEVRDQEQKVHDKSPEIGTTRELLLNDSYKSRKFTPPPLVAALKASAEENAASFHFPGHNRGQAAPASLTQIIGDRAFTHDLPELPELDNLFAPEGPILEAQKYAAELFGASETWFLVGGSTCGIQAAIMSTCSPGDILILPRNAHISAISAMVLTGVVPKYIVPHYDSKWDVAAGITPLQLEEALKDLEMEGKKPAAILVVSPSYHGICSNILEISKLCHDNKIPLIVDEAHGAHFGFHPHLPTSALAQGADIVVQSTHKTLCSLTQSSMLHLAGDLVDRDRIRRCLQLLQSSSPSYLLLASLDAARAQLSDKSEAIFSEALELAEEAKSIITKIPRIPLINIVDFPKFPAIDPLRVTVGTWQVGLSGFAADDILSREFGIVCELIGTRSFTLAFNLGTKKDHVLRLVSGLQHLSKTSCSSLDCSIAHAAELYLHFQLVLNPRDAFFAKKKRVTVEDSIGKICGELICPYPPGIPVLIPGEVITQAALKYLFSVKSRNGCIIGAADPELLTLVICSN